MSREHLLHVGYYGNLRPARDVSVGDDVMVAINGNVVNTKVTGKETVMKSGVYCPHTTGNEASSSSSLRLHRA